MEKSTEILEVDLVKLFNYLKKRILIIALVCALFATGGYVWTKMFVDPVYTTHTRMYVLNRSREDNVVTSDFQIATYVMNDYKALITGTNVTREVINRLGINMSPGALAGMIWVSSPENTRVLQINITSTDPQLAADVANCVREVASEQIKEIMAVDAVNMLYPAEVPTYPSGPNTTKNAVMAGLVGAVLMIGIFTVIFLMDDTIRTEEDVTRYLGLNILGVIPASAELEGAGTTSGAKQKKRKFGLGMTKRK